VKEDRFATDVKTLMRVVMMKRQKKNGKNIQQAGFPDGHPL
jgi:hypothetical protein